MKLLIPILVVIVAMWVNTAAKASTSVKQNCDAIETCFLIDQQALLPDGHISTYPTVVYNGSSLPKRFRTGGERAFIFSPRLKQWAAYDKDGYLVASGRANGGSHWCSDLGRPCKSPAGSHRVYNKGTASCTSSKYPLGAGGAPMPYCMFFKGGYAIHGSPYISNVNGSHGCIRVKTDAAAWLHKYFIRSGTKVIVLPY